MFPAEIEGKLPFIWSGFLDEAIRPNLELLRVAAKLLSPIVDELVFVGGCTTGLLISDEAMADVRPTFDVDAISEITSYADYVNLSERLLKLGFTPDISEGAPLCRWQHGETKVDVMPLDEKILGFSIAGISPRSHRRRSIRLKRTFAFA